MELALNQMTSKWVLGVLCLVSLSVLGSAYILETFFDVHPCQMCLYERNIFIGATGVSFLGFFSPLKFQNSVITFLGLLFLGGSLLASYHVAIQQHWVAAPGFCAVNDFSAFEDLESLKAQLLSTPFVRCDKVTWSLFGLSLAAYNALLSMGLSFLCALWLVKQR